MILSRIILISSLFLAIFFPPPLYARAEGEAIDEFAAIWPSPSTEKMLLALGEGNTVVLYNRKDQSSRRLDSLQTPGSWNTFVWSPDEKRIGFKIFREGGEIPALFNLESGAIVELAPGAAAVSLPTFSIGGEVAVIAGGELVLRGKDGDVKKRLKLEGEYSQPALSPDASSCAVIGPHGRLKLIDLTSGEMTVILKSDTEYLSPLWSPDGKRILVRTITGELEVLDISTGKKFDLGPGDTPAWLPDSRRVVYARNQGLISHGQQESGIYIADYQGHGRRELDIGLEKDNSSVDVGLSRSGHRMSIFSREDGRVSVLSLEEKKGTLRPQKQELIRINLKPESRQ